MSQPSLFDSHFDGKTYDPALDKDRLKKQLGRTYEVMARGHWVTLEELARWTGDPESSVSARLRDLRKPKFGGYDIERRHRGEKTAGLYEYRMVR